MIDENSEENKKHIKHTYQDKAHNLLTGCVFLSFFSFSTYILGMFLYQSFDFGLIFEIITFIFIILALKKVNQSDYQNGKIFTIIAMIPIGWLIIYDLINLLANIKEVITEVIHYFVSFDFLFYYLEPYLYDVELIAMLALLIKAYLSLNRADGSIETNNYTDTFYDNL